MLLSKGCHLASQNKTFLCKKNIQFSRGEFEPPT